MNRALVNIAFAILRMLDGRLDHEMKVQLVSAVDALKVSACAEVIVPRCLSWHAFSSCSLLVTAAVAAVYWPLLEGDREFLDYDDERNYPANGFIHAPLSVSSVANIVQDGVVLATYEPVSLVIRLVLCSSYWGCTIHSVLALNIALHATNAVLGACVGIAFVKLLASQYYTHGLQFAMFAAAFLQAVHPLRVEVVAWASGNSYGLATCFGLLSLLAFLQLMAIYILESSATGATLRALLWALVSFALFALAVFSKAATATLPAIFVLVFALVCGRNHDKRGSLWDRQPAAVWCVLLHLSMCILTAGVGVMAAMRSTDSLHRQVAHTMGELVSLPLDKTLLRAQNMMLYYCAAPLFPWERFTPRMIDLSATSWCFNMYGAAGVLAVHVYALANLVGRNRISSRWFLAFLWVIFVLSLLPTLGLCSNHIQWGAADRYSYFPAHASFVGASGILLFLLWRKSALATLVIWGIFVCSAVCHSRSRLRVWTNRVTFWEHVVSANPLDGIALVRVADHRDVWQHHASSTHHDQPAACILEGTLEHEIAAPSAYDSIESAAHSFNNRGSVAFADRRLREAAFWYREAIAVNPSSAKAHFNIGALLSQTQGDHVTAKKHYQEALAILPSFTDAQNNLGAIMMNFQRFDEAESCFRALVAHSPADEEGWSNLGMALRKQGARKLPDATAALRHAASLAPNNADIISILARVHEDAGHSEESRRLYALAVALEAQYNPKQQT
jgi:Flp pilus assembly protein TadD